MSPRVGAMPSQATPTVTQLGTGLPAHSPELEKLVKSWNSMLKRVSNVDMQLKVCTRRDTLLKPIYCHIFRECSDIVAGPYSGVNAEGRRT